MILESLNPKSVFYFFEQLSNIPRCSGNEKQISDYLVKFAKDRNLFVLQDNNLNVIIKKEASNTKKKSQPLILQAHMDMVCERLLGTDHDFEVDPLSLFIDGDYIKAKNTTLGADNGIAVAMIMAVLDDKNIEHPALEAVFTTEEETGLTGAANLDMNIFDSKRLINIDSDTEDQLFVSCAGGARADICIDIKKIQKNGYISKLITIKDLIGGHSGSMIDKGRGNCIIFLARLLRFIEEKGLDIYLSNFNAGQKENAIPREGQLCVSFDPKDEKIFLESLSQFEKILKDEYAGIDNINITSIDFECDGQVYAKEVSDRIIATILMLPNGIISMSATINGLVESSNNIGVISDRDNKVKIECALRSSVESKLEFILTKIKEVAKFLAESIVVRGRYPAWEYKSESELRQNFIEVYKQIFKKEPTVTAIHAGLECGIFSGKKPDLDIISFGPNIYNAHNPDESVSISSVARIYELLVKLLGIL